LTAGEIGGMLLDGEPRIMSHAQGNGHSFVIRPAAMKQDEYKVVAQRLSEIFHNPPKPASKPAPQPAAADLAGRWDVEVQYQVGSAKHKLFLTHKGNQIAGSHVAGFSKESSTARLTAIAWNCEACFRLVDSI